MKTLAISALLLAASAAAAPAATLGLAVDPAVSISETGVGAENDPVFFGFAVYGAGAATGTGYAGVTTDLAIDIFDASGIELVVGGFDAGGYQEVLVGTVTATGFAGDDDVNYTDVIELLVTLSGGQAMAAFGGSALVTLTGEFGSDPFGAGFAYDTADIAINALATATVPLPAALPLLGAGLAGLALLRRRRG